MTSERHSFEEKLSEAQRRLEEAEEEKQALSHVINSLENKIARNDLLDLGRKDDLDETFQRLETMKEKLVQSETRYTALQKKLTEKQSLFEATSETCRQLQYRQQQADQNIESLTARLTSYQADMSKQSFDSEYLQTLEASAHELRHRVKALEQELAQKQADYSLAQDKAAELLQFATGIRRMSPVAGASSSSGQQPESQQMVQHKKDMDEMRDEIFAQRQLIEQSNEELSTLKQKIAEQDEQHISVLEQHRSEQEQLHRRSDDIIERQRNSFEDQLQETHEALSAMQRLVELEREHASESVSELQLLEKQCEELTFSLELEKSERQTAEQALDKQQHAQQKLNQQVEQLEHKLDQTHVRLKSHNVRINQLVEERDDERRQRMATETELQAARESVQQSRESLEHSQALVKKLESYGTFLQTLKHQKEELEHEVSRLEGTLKLEKRETAAIPVMKERIQELTDSREGLMKQLSHYTSKCDALSREVEALEESFELSQGQLHELQRQEKERDARVERSHEQVVPGNAERDLRMEAAASLLSLGAGIPVSTHSEPARSVLPGMSDQRELDRSQTVSCQYRAETQSADTSALQARLGVRTGIRFNSLKGN